jgi:signal transduction histidine kinase
MIRDTPVGNPVVADASPAWATLPQLRTDWAAVRTWLNTTRRAAWARGAGLPEWVQAHTFVPSWLPVRWQHPLTGYGAAVLLQALAVLLTYWLLQGVPSFPSHTLLVMVVVVLVSLTFGAGPSLTATAVGIVLLWYALLEPPGWQLAGMGDALSLVLLTTVGVLISAAVSRAEHARRQAMAATRARDVFLSLAAHELRTPVTAYMGTVELAKWRLQRLTAAAQQGSVDVATDAEAIFHLLAQADTAAERQNRLIAELLDVSRIQAGTLTFQFARCDLAAIVRDAVAEQQQMQRGREIRMDLLACPVLVVADGERLRQVVTNYLTNALKYAPADQPIDVTLTAAAGHSRVAVQDRGPGLSPDEQSRVWDLYHRVPGIVASGSDQGLGLGLHLCSRIMLAHPGGQIGVDGTVGVGSVFWFSLPLAPADA